MWACDTCSCLPLTTAPHPPPSLQDAESRLLQFDRSWSSAGLPPCLSSSLTDREPGLRWHHAGSWWMDWHGLQETGGLNEIWTDAFTCNVMQSLIAAGIMFGLFYRLPRQITGVGPRCTQCSPVNMTLTAPLASSTTTTPLCRRRYRVGRGLDPRL